VGTMQRLSAILLACHLETPIETPAKMMDLVRAYFRILFLRIANRYFCLPSRGKYLWFYYC
jgi:hypothetical protein